MSFYAVFLIIAEPAKVTITVKTTHPSRGLSQVPQNQMQMDNCPSAPTTPKHVHVHHPTTQAGKEHSRIQCNESLLTTMCGSYTLHVAYFKKQYIAYVIRESDLRRVMGEEIRGTGQWHRCQISGLLLLLNDTSSPLPAAQMGQQMIGGMTDRNDF